MSKANNSVLNFIRRNAYYLIIGVALIVTALVILAVLLGREQPVAELPKGESVKEEPISDSDNTESLKPTSGETDDSADKGDDKEKEPESSQPTDTRIVFTLPVSNAAVTKDFTSATVVYNKTLGVYTGHMGVDFSAEAGTKVVAAYSGTVESVTSSYLEGTTVTIDHGNGLKTVYNSIEADENLVAGKTVSAGQVIGTVSDNNRQEYKDGPHLHFETVLDGLKIDPETYLMLAEK